MALLHIVRLTRWWHPEADVQYWVPRCTRARRAWRAAQQNCHPFCKQEYADGSNTRSRDQAALRRANGSSFFNGIRHGSHGLSGHQ